MKNTQRKGNSRRDFLRTAVIGSVFGAASLSAKATTELQHRGEKETGTWMPFIEKICPIIDCNLHAPSDSTGYNMQWKTIYPTTKEFVDYLNLCGVDYGIVNSSLAYKDTAEDFIQASGETLTLVKEHPKRFVPAINVNAKLPLSVKKKIFFENAKRLIEAFDHEKKFVSFLV